MMFKRPTSPLSLLLSSSLLILACDKGDSSATPDESATEEAPVAEAEEPARVYPDPPPPGPAPEVNFPDIESFELPNKLKVYVVENHETPLVNARLFVRAGEIHHELHASMTGSLVREGSKKYPKKKLDEAFEQVGSSFNVITDTHDTVISTRALSRDLGSLLKILSDVVQKPSMPEDALDKAKEAQMTQLNSLKSDGGSLGQRLMGTLLYPEGHPYGRPFVTEEQIKAVDVAKLKEFHEAWWRPNNAHLIISGDITKDEAEKLVKSSLGKWMPAESFPNNPLESFDAAAYQGALPDKLTVHVVDRPSISAEIFVGNLALPRNHPDWVKFQVTNTILGAGGFTARLFKDIRETRKLTYNINSMVVPAKGIGPFMIATQSSKIDEMMVAIFEHIDQIRGEAPSEEEFATAKSKLTLSFPGGLETPGQIAGKVATQVGYSLPDDYWSTYRGKIDDMKIEEVQTIASKFIHEVPIVVIVGRASKVKRALGKVPALEGAEIVEYDRDLVKQ